MYLVKYIKMDYDDRTQRIWQAIFPSSACIAILESMAMNLLCALINLITKQETSIKSYPAPLKPLNFTDNSENMYRGGYAQEFTPNYLIFKRSSEGITLPSVRFSEKQSQDIRCPRHAVMVGWTCLYTPVTYDARRNCACMCPGLFVFNREQINHT